MKQYIQKYKSLPLSIQLAGGAAGLFILYKTYRLLFKSEQEKANQQLVDSAKDELTKFLKKYKLSYQPSQYAQFANMIYEGTKYGIGDNYPAVVDAMTKMNNDADVAMLIKVYGARQNYIFGIPQGEPRDLFTNVKTELGSEYGGLTHYKLDRINDNWKSKGITYKI